MVSTSLSAVTLATFILYVGAVDSTAPVNYARHKVIRITITNRQQLKIVQQAGEDLRYGIDVWKESVKGNSTLADLLVCPGVYDELMSRLKEASINYDIMFGDLQSVIDEQKEDEVETSRRSESAARRRRSTHEARGARQAAHSDTADLTTDEEINEIIGRYANHSEINRWLRMLRRRRPQIVDLIDIGMSYENRPMLVIKVSEPSSPGVVKPAIWIDAGIHAREWIAPATAIYFIRALVSGYRTDLEVTSLIRQYDWFILPMINPDGYSYSRTVDRLWRKTRSRVTHGQKPCYGVDGNRNFDFQWLSECSNLASTVQCRGRQPCDYVFAGYQPLSEPETIAVANFIHSHRASIKMYLTLHSYSQLWLTPWGFTADESDDHADMMRVGRKGVEALGSVHQTEYDIGSPALLLYPATGGSYDWAKGKEGIKYSYTIELRDKGRHGFLLPVDQIVPTGEETWAGVKAAVHELSYDTCWVRGESCPDLTVDNVDSNLTGTL